LRASRSFPFASKVLGQNFIEIATRIFLEEKMEVQEKNLLDIQDVGVKAAQFSFSRLKNADPNLGVEMSSTGEVACFGKTMEEAFLKSLISVGFSLPQPNSKILLTLGRVREKADSLSMVRKFQKLGFSFIGTAGTAEFLRKADIDCETVYKVSEDKHPNVVDMIDDKKVGLVINTSNRFSHEEVSDGYLIRRKAVDRNIPLLTNLQLGKLLARSLTVVQDVDDLGINPYCERDLC